jgi:hypothetical protein
METFKFLLRIVFVTELVLSVLTALVSVTGGPTMSIGIFLFWFNLVYIPVFITFIFVLLYQCLFKRKPVSFFKTELIYLLMQISAFAFLSYVDPGH